MSLLDLMKKYVHGDRVQYTSIDAMGVQWHGEIGTIIAGPIEYAGNVFYGIINLGTGQHVRVPFERIQGKVMM